MIKYQSAELKQIQTTKPTRSHPQNKQQNYIVQYKSDLTLFKENNKNPSTKQLIIFLNESHLRIIRRRSSRRRRIMIWWTRKDSRELTRDFIFQRMHILYFNLFFFLPFFLSFILYQNSTTLNVKKTKQKDSTKH